MSRWRSVLPVFLGATLCVGPARGAEPAAADKKAVEPASILDTLEVGLRGSVGREANSRDYDWGPTLSLGLFSSGPDARNRFCYELEYSYNDAFSELRGDAYTQQTRVKTSELKYAKVSLLKLAGRDLRERFHFTPYLTGGVQYVDSREETREEDEDGELALTERRRESYWAPTLGAGVEFALGSRTTLALDYDRNFESGNRRMHRLNLELKVRLFGDDEEKER
ncbi:MAG: autotransporter outer membrane beta-barrel domain-containing protein [Elusimicrobiota bacterium]|jgi:opacity protein-like surface antigen